jgi:hypothetical protein
MGMRLPPLGVFPSRKRASYLVLSRSDELAKPVEGLGY